MEMESFHTLLLKLYSNYNSDIHSVDREEVTALSGVHTSETMNLGQIWHMILAVILSDAITVSYLD